MALARVPRRQERKDTREGTCASKLAQPRLSSRNVGGQEQLNVSGDTQKLAGNREGPRGVPGRQGVHRREHNGAGAGCCSPPGPFPQPEGVLSLQLLSPLVL